MKVGDLVKFKATTTWARKTELTGGPAIVLVADALTGAVQILTRNQKQVWVSAREVEVISENR